MSTDWTLTCPYCDALHPDPTGGPPKAPDRALTEPVLCLPYTRDIGRFDDGDWSRIGRDFYDNVLGWHRFGIMRVSAAETIFYRVGRCPSCGHLFDVLANYTPGRCLAAIWPHLLGPDEGEPSDAHIARYRGNSRVGRLMEWVIGPQPDLFSELALSLSVGLLAALLSLLPLLGDWRQHLVAIAIRSGGGLWLSLLLLLQYRFIQFLRAGSGFADLYAVRRPAHVTFWQNYTLCRAVGVRETGKQPGIAPPSQSAMVGVASVLIIFLVWILTQMAANAAGRLLALTWLLLPMALLYPAGALWQAGLLRRRGRRRGARRDAMLPIKTRGLALVGLWLAAWTLALLLRGGISLSALLEIAFWALVAFLAGQAMWIGLNTSGYILAQAQRLPMHLDPLDRFRRLEPLERIAGISTSLVLVNLMATIAIVVAYTLAGVVAQTESLRWLLAWVSVGIMVVLIALGVATSFYAKSALFAGGAYVLAMLALTLTPKPTLAADLDLRVLLTGVFLTFVTYLHTRGAYQPLVAVRTAARQALIERYDNLIAGLQREIESLSGGAQQAALHSDTIHQLCANLESLTTLRTRVSRAGTSGGRPGRLLSIAAPFATSVLLPIGVDLFSNMVLSIIVQP